MSPLIARRARIGFAQGRSAHRPRLTRTQRTAIKADERARWRATSQQCPGASPGRRLERITSPRFLAPQARGGHESRASQVVGRRALSPASMLTVSASSQHAIWRSRRWSLSSCVACLDARRFGAMPLHRQPTSTPARSRHKHHALHPRYIATGTASRSPQPDRVPRRRARPRRQRSRPPPRPEPQRPPTPAASPRPTASAERSARSTSRNGRHSNTRAETRVPQPAAATPGSPLPAAARSGEAAAAATTPVLPVKPGHHRLALRDERLLPTQAAPEHTVTARRPRKRYFRCRRSAPPVLSHPAHARPQLAQPRQPTRLSSRATACRSGTPRRRWRLRSSWN